MAKVILTGVPRIDRKLARLGSAKLVNKIVRAAMRRAMKPVRDEAKAQAPEGETGALEAAPKVRSGGRSRKGVSVVVSIRSGDTGSNYYAAFREFGTSKMAGDPYMSRAYEAKKDEAKASVADEVLKGIEAEAKK